jgi:hypothetical protein
MKKKLNENSVRVIKISKEALFEFIYEKFIEDQEDFLDVDSLEVANAFDISFERGEFIFCAYKSEDTNGRIIELPREIDLQRVMANIPDTTNTIFYEDRYKDYTKEELIEISKK